MIIKKFLLAFTSLIPSICIAAPEIKGTLQELRGLIYPASNVVTIHGNAEETAYSDLAIISLLITTEEDQLSDAIAANHFLRTKLRESLVAAGINEDKIKNSKFSSFPQYGWLGKNLIAIK